MRLLVTADLHFNHARSREPAIRVIDEMNGAGGDAVLVVGDTSVSDEDGLEQCLSRFKFAGEKLFVAGNHELWTRGEDSRPIFFESLPRRVRELGWRWLQDEPYVSGDRSFAIVGSVGWYDYSFAVENLGIPRRFYEAKVSPGAARRLSDFSHLLDQTDDISPAALETVARWNDGKFVKLHQSDETFLQTLLDQLESQLDALRDVPRVATAIHCVPFAELLPPRHGAQWDFVRAYLGSEKIGKLLLRYQNIRDVICGHSHFAKWAQVGSIRAQNIGSGYREKRFVALDL